LTDESFDSFILFSTYSELRIVIWNHLPSSILSSLKTICFSVLLIASKYQLTKRLTLRLIYAEMVMLVYNCFCLLMYSCKKTIYGYSNDFEVNIGMHQGSALSPLLFAIDTKALSREFSYLTMGVVVCR